MLELIAVQANLQILVVLCYTGELIYTNTEINYIEIRKDNTSIYDNKLYLESTYTVNWYT